MEDIPLLLEYQIYSQLLRTCTINEMSEIQRFLLQDQSSLTQL